MNPANQKPFAVLFCHSATNCPVIPQPIVLSFRSGAEESAFAFAFVLAFAFLVVTCRGSAVAVAVP
jgi:hypothetical protein